MCTRVLPYYNPLPSEDILPSDDLEAGSLPWIEDSFLSLPKSPFTSLNVSENLPITRPDDSQEEDSRAASPTILSDVGGTIPEIIEDKSSTSLYPEAEADQQTRKSSLLGSIAHTTNYFIGVGVLGLPYAFSCSGWIGLPTMIILGILMAYSGRLIGRCLKEHSLSTYPDIAEKAYGKRGRNIASVVFYTMLLFDCTLFYVLSVSSVQALLPVNNTGMQISKMIPFINAAMMIGLTNSFTNMQSLSRLSAIGTASTLSLCVMLVAMYIVSFKPNIDKNSEGGWQNQTDIWRGPIALAKSFGVISFSFMGHQVLPSVHRSMKRPTEFPFVMDVTFGLTVFWYVLVGGLGYLAFGRGSQDNIVDNLKDFKLNWPVHLITSVLVAVTSTSKFTLASFPLTAGIIDISLNSSYLTVVDPSKESCLGGAARLESSPLNKQKHSSGDEEAKFFKLNKSYSSLGTTSCDFDTDFSCVGECDDREAENLPFDEEKDEGYLMTSLENRLKLAEKGLITVTGIDGEEKSQEFIDNDIIANKQRVQTVDYRIAIVKLLIRTAVPLIALGLSFVLTNFLQLMSIIGAVFGLLISLVIPLLCFRKLFKEQIPDIENVLIIFFVVLSFALMFSGLWSSVN